MQFYGQTVDDLSMRRINKLFRQNDESHLWPVSGEFNVTELAIRRLQRNNLPNIGTTGGIEYAMLLDHEISRIVNTEI